ncbi:hypothetical protein F443_16644, partial [Phytophthora nicotianae P1569]
EDGNRATGPTPAPSADDEQVIDETFTSSTDDERSTVETADEQCQVEQVPYRPRAQARKILATPPDPASDASSWASRTLIQPAGHLTPADTTANLAPKVNRQCPSVGKESADKRGRKIKAKFTTGERVLLSTDGIQNSAITNLGASKLASRFIGPFKITKVLGDAYKLDIPVSLRLHPTFYVRRLKKYFPATIPATPQTAEPEARRSAVPRGVRAVVSNHPIQVHVPDPALQSARDRESRAPVSSPAAPVMPIRLPQSSRGVRRLRRLLLGDVNIPLRVPELVHQCVIVLTNQDANVISATAHLPLLTLVVISTGLLTISWHTRILLEHRLAPRSNLLRDVPDVVRDYETTLAESNGRAETSVNGIEIADHELENEIVDVGVHGNVNVIENVCCQQRSHDATAESDSVEDVANISRRC